MKYLKIATTFIVINLFVGLVFGYDNFIIHPKLSSAAIEVYKKVYSDKLTSQKEGWIVEGATAEDADPRYLNHFYDPTTGKGLNDGLFSGLPVNKWAQVQNSISGDYSEPAILKNYRDGDFKRAYQGIGHMLHLVQDMSVPAHTRLDAHPDGDPYEAWAAENGAVGVSKPTAISLTSLNEAFDGLSKYSHDNFFSKDTINIKDSTQRENGYILCVNKNVLFKCAKETITASTVYYTIDDAVHSDYWNLLAPKAVAYSAGVIEYFENKFAEIDAEEKQKLGFLDKTSNVIAGIGGNVVYSLGDLNIVFQAGRGLAKDVVVTVGTVAVNTTVGAFTDLYYTTLAVGGGLYHASIFLGDVVINTTAAVGGAIGNTVVGIGSFTRDAVTGLFSGNLGPSDSNTASIIGSLQNPLPPSYVATPSIPPSPPAPQIAITPSNNSQPPFGQAPPPPQVPIVPTGAFQAPQTSSRLATTGAGSGGGGQQPMSFGGGSTQQEAPQNSLATFREPIESPTATSTEPAVVLDGIVSATTSAPIYTINPVIFSGEYHNSTSTFDAINIELKNTTLDTATTSEIILVQATTTDEILSFNKEVDIPTSGIWQYRARLENTDNASTTPWSIFNYFEANFATTTATGTLPVATTTYVMVFETPNPANILFSDLNQNGIADSEEENVVASSSAWLVAGEYVFNNLTITNNAIITAAGNENSSSTFKGVKIFAKNLTVETGASISGNGQGYTEGPGYVPQAGIASDPSASYGGVGACGAASSTYGSAVKPVDLGSGMWSRGGGAVSIVVTDAFTNDGSISADGAGYRTSGGSININTNKLFGNGSLRANGAYAYWPYCGSGGGGRIAVHYASSSFAGSAVGAGTAAFFDDAHNDVYIEKSFRFQKNDEPLNYHNIYLTNGASVEIEKGVTLTANSISLTGISRLTISDDATINARDISATGGSFVTLGAGVVMNVPSITIGQGSTMTLQSGEPLIIGSLAIKDGGALGAGSDQQLRLIVKNLEIGAGSTVSKWTAQVTSNPDDFFSSGEGASVYIKSSGKFINNGSVSANGPAGKIGGSIYVEADELEGSGSFASAGGGMVWCGWNCGFVIPSGGRVAVYYNNSSFDGVAVAPGACGTPDGGFLPTCGGNGKVVIDNISNKIVIPPPAPLILSSEKAVTFFNLNIATSTISGIIDEIAHTISLTVPFVTDVTALVPTITVSPLAISSPVSGVAQDFTAPVTYTITAEDGSTQSYVVTVVVEAPPAVVLPVISSYTFNGAEGDITADFATTTPTVELSLTANKDVDWVSVTIENQADSSKHKRFQDGNECKDGTNSCLKTWDGILSGATSTAPLGVYRIKAHVKDTDGNDFNDYLSPYTITIISPEPDI